MPVSPVMTGEKIPACRCAVLGALAICWISSAWASVSLPAIFSDRMVFQRDGASPVWGTADRGEEIVVRLGGVEAKTKADDAGKWKVELDVAALPEGPHTLVVQGTNRLEVREVVLGEVWMCAGQSNMAFSLRSALGADEDIKHSSEVDVREFRVGGVASPEPREKCGGGWVKAAPSTAGEFTAVGYYFARDIARKLESPVGLVHAAVGGTPVEAWMSREALARLPELQKTADAMREEWQVTFPNSRETYLTQLEKWQERHERKDLPEADISPWATGSTSDWKEVNLPGKLTTSGLPGSGSVWLRCDVDAPPELSEATYCAVDVAQPTGPHAVYWNGKKIGEVDSMAEIVSFTGAMRRYVVPSGQVRSTGNTIAVRLFHPAEGLGILGDAGRISLAYRNGQMDGRIPLAGKWRAKAERELPVPTAGVLAELPPLPGKPPNGSQVGAALFNGYVAPVVPYGIRGFLWYQGENNVAKASLYRDAFSGLIQDWRHQWKNEDLPFYFCQLPNFSAKTAQPSESDWSELRDAQAGALALPHTGMAVLIDIGEAGDIHPRNKRPAGERLAAQALAKTYGEKTPAGGPIFEKATVEGSRIRVHFSSEAGPLAAAPLPAEYVKKSVPLEAAPLVLPMPESPLQGFALCGSDGKWQWASARIDGNTVVVESTGVPQPVAVRYAWGGNPTCNLTDASRIPAAPFRSGDLSSTASAKK